MIRIQVFRINNQLKTTLIDRLIVTTKEKIKQKKLTHLSLVLVMLGLFRTKTGHLLRKSTNLHLTQTRLNKGVRPSPS